MSKPADPKRRHSVTFASADEKRLVMQKLRARVEDELERRPHEHVRGGPPSDSRIAVEVLRRAAGLVGESQGKTNK